MLQLEILSRCYFPLVPHRRDGGIPHPHSQWYGVCRRGGWPSNGLCATVTDFGLDIIATVVVFVIYWPTSEKCQQSREGGASWISLRSAASHMGGGQSKMTINHRFSQRVEISAKPTEQFVPVGSKCRTESGRRPYQYQEAYRLRLRFGSMDTSVEHHVISMVTLPRLRLPESRTSRPGVSARLLVPSSGFHDSSFLCVFPNPGSPNTARLHSVPTPLYGDAYHSPC